MRYAHAEQINATREALDSIASHAGYLSISDVANQGGQGRLAERAKVAQDALRDVLIIAKAYTDDAVAGGALDAR
jgi:hypothetical protein